MRSTDGARASGDSPKGAPATTHARAGNTDDTSGAPSTLLGEDRGVDITCRLYGRIRDGVVCVDREEFDATEIAPVRAEPVRRKL
jgi:hypothetical protein